MTLSQGKDFIFRVLNGFRGVPFNINNSTIRFDESLRRWDFSSEFDMLRVIKKRLNAGDTFVDIGANFGLHTLYAGTLLNNTGRVIAFEPLPQNISLLEKNIVLNRFSNVTIVQGAVSNSNNEYLDFYIPEEKFLQTGALQPTSTVTKKLQVKNYRLDDMRLQIEKPVKLIKIDVEGAEMEVLKSAERILLEWHPDLLIEVHGFALPDFGYTSEQLLQYLKGLGYSEDRIQVNNQVKEEYFQSFFYYNK